MTLSIKIIRELNSFSILSITDYQNLKTLIDENPYNETFCIAEGGSFESQPKFAIAMLMPVLLAMFFILPHWWKNEKKTSNFNKIFTFILILFQFYPQWKMLQVLYWGLWKKDLKWKEAKENLQRNVGSLGKFFLKTSFIFNYWYF